MSIWYIIKLVFLLIYFTLSAIITFIIHKEEKTFSKPLYVSKKPETENELEEKVNIHDEFDVFTKRDKPTNIILLFLGVLLFMWIRFILYIICGSLISFTINRNSKKKNNNLSKEDIDYNINKTKFFTNIFLKLSCIFIDKQRLTDDVVLPVYKKYFGPNYQIDYDSKFGCYISNHTCLYDLLCSMAFYGTGFVAKEAIKKVPVFGPMATALQSIFVNRNNDKSKSNVLEQITKRENDYFKGEPVMPFMIFPEGTTTSGRHILKFKRGAFWPLLPVKATIILPNLSKNNHLGVGSSDVGINFLKSLTKLYNTAQYFELPIMKPNDYMYQNYSSYGKDKWEIYAEVVREIMCTLGHFQKSSMSLTDSYRYCSCIEQKCLLDRKGYKVPT